jgi:hypothetical protein
LNEFNHGKVDLVINEKENDSFSLSDRSDGEGENISTLSENLSTVLIS